MPDPSADLARLRSGDAETFRRIVRANHRALALLADALDDRAAAPAIDAAWRDWLDDLPRLTADAELTPALFTRLAERLRTGDPAARLAAMAAAEPDEPVLADSRFDPDQSWARPMKSWDDLAAGAVVNGGTVADHVAAAVAGLSPPQRAVLVLCDIAKLPAAAVADLLGIDAKLQSRLRHRAHARLRAAVERQVGM